MDHYVPSTLQAGLYHAIQEEAIIPRKKSDKAFAAEPVVHEAQFEAIIDQETFDKAAAMLRLLTEEGIADVGG